MKTNIHFYHNSIHLRKFSNFFSENRAFCEKMWRNIVERGRSLMTIWRMRSSL
jgi:hypothetical protein